MIRFYLILTIISTVFISSCGTARETRVLPSETAVFKEEKAPPVLKDAYIFSSEDIYGNSFSLAAFKGKVILINFFAVWCPSCAMEISGLTQLYDELQDNDFIIIGISIGKTSKEAVKEFSRRSGIRYPVILARDDIIEKYGYDGSLPSSFLINKNLNTVKIFKGYHDKRVYKDEINKLLGE